MKRRKIGVQNDDFVIFCAARFVDWKGQLNLIAALPSVIIKNPSAKLVLAGDGSLLDKAKEIVSNLGIGKNVVFLGSRDDIYELLAVSDAFSLVFSYPDKFNAEGIGVAGLEAMAFGLPVLVGDYPETHKFIKNEVNGIIVAPKNPEALAAAINKIITDENLRINIGQKAQRFIEEFFSLRNVIAIYESIYKKISRA